MTADEPALDLAVVAAVASSVRNRAIDARTAVFGEVGLAGEVRADDAGGPPRSRGGADGIHPVRHARGERRSDSDPGLADLDVRAGGRPYGSGGIGAASRVSFHRRHAFIPFLRRPHGLVHTRFGYSFSQASCGQPARSSRSRAASSSTSASGVALAGLGIVFESRLHDTNHRP